MKKLRVKYHLKYHPVRFILHSVRKLSILVLQRRSFDKPKWSNEMYSVSDVAKYFLTKDSMSPKKLQKIVYYAYGWTLALLNERSDDLEFRLFENRIEAWVHGPVIPNLYQEYKLYGWQNIPQCKEYKGELFSEDVADLLNQVWDAYGDFTANELEAISHKEKPWINARKGVPPYEVSDNVISDTDIFDYFNEQANSE